MIRSLALMLPFSVATISDCGGGSDSEPTYADADGDGFDTRTDCDDSDAYTYPGATEFCDAVDNDCDGYSDDDGTISWEDNYGIMSDMTSTLSTGADLAATELTIAEDGTLRVCGGDWYLNIIVDGAYDVSIEGLYGASTTVIDGGWTGSVLSVTDYATVRVEGVTLSGGVADFGGAIYAESADLTVSDVAIADSFVDIDGGGIYAYDSLVALQDVSIADSTADFDGGGAFFYSSVVDMDTVTVSGNAAAGFGGGIYAYDTVLVVDDSDLSDNYADYSGGALYADSALIDIYDTNLDDNTAISYGGAAFLLESDLDLDGVVSYDNLAGSGGDGFFVGTDSTLDVYSSDLYNASEDVETFYGFSYVTTSSSATFSCDELLCVD